jgi:hypothetical protein
LQRQARANSRSGADFAVASADPRDEREYNRSNLLIA